MTKKRAALALLLLVPALAVALSASHPKRAPLPAALPPPAPGAAPDFTRIRAGCFVQDAGNPVLAKGQLREGATWNDPHVLKIGSQFVMYASADTDFDQNIRIFRLVSGNGRDWELSPKEPVLERSADPAAWDHASVETPAVVFFRGQYYLFYTGYPVSQKDPFSYRVGYATSPDGITWTKQGVVVAPSNPASKTPDLSFRQWITAEPGPVVFGDKLYLYFTAEGAHMSVQAPLMTLGLTTSDDGKAWSEPKMALAPDQKLYPRNGAPFSTKWLGYSTPHAAVLGGRMHLFFDVATDDPFKQRKIHHASSADGSGGWELDAEALFDRDQAAWTDDTVNGPAVLLDGSTLYLWYGGQGALSRFPDIKMGIGLARCALGG